MKFTQNINVVGSMCYHFLCIVDHGLCDETLEIGVPYFVDVKYHFDQQILTMNVINELYDKIWIENFVMTCSKVIDVLVENQGQNLDDQKIVIIGISST
ncbi:hypothetical protein PFNF54_02682 [Plasmodium falciparum NF54]|uniref:Uncharacterized protein n=1 Tax=Plasmodium falciparum (isolate NF54) TaxID=5843 RepID=W7JV41_PLAFO|nr:hypothetical protein PFNF54_02682 [Plasmodium falciparum NF54]